MTTSFITPRDLLRKYRTDLFDFSAAGLEWISQKVGPVSCRRGCSYCCSAKVVIDVGEGVLIYLHLVATGQWNEGLMEKLAEADDAMSAVSHDQWLPQRRPCVFLKEKEYGKGECGVYAARPMSCAAMFAIGDPKDCGTVGGRNLVGYVNTGWSQKFLELYASIIAGLGADVWMMTIPGAVLMGFALVNELPLPPVRRVHVTEMHDDDGERACLNFDRLTGALPP
jgi:Fe-S-cluster containining protein